MFKDLAGRGEVMEAIETLNVLERMNHGRNMQDLYSHDAELDGIKIGNVPVEKVFTSDMGDISCKMSSEGLKVTRRQSTRTNARGEQRIDGYLIPQESLQKLCKTEERKVSIRLQRHLYAGEKTGVAVFDLLDENGRSLNFPQSAYYFAREESKDDILKRIGQDLVQYGINLNGSLGTRQAQVFRSGVRFKDLAKEVRPVGTPQAGESQ